ncbi:hypothetical protein QTP86_013108 [Hemibagrus guttatus]|nr:hypothetical protein QTP86_013108 [Hemibagrus guttatus]
MKFVLTIRMVKFGNVLRRMPFLTQPSLFIRAWDRHRSHWTVTPMARLYVPVIKCQCPAQFDGPECQQTKHSFHGNGYAWFPPIRPCFESHLSLEFITEVADGLLLYSGPLAPLQPWEPEDFMAIELIDGTPTLKINHGSGTLVLQLPGNVNVADRRWHRLDVRSNSKDMRFTLDRCAGATVMEMEGVGSWLTTEDHTSCEVTGVTPSLDRHLNGTQVLQLGGVNENVPYIYPQLQHKHFTGCISNLVVDSKGKQNPKLHGPV